MQSQLLSRPRSLWSFQSQLSPDKLTSTFPGKLSFPGELTFPGMLTFSGKLTSRPVLIKTGAVRGGIKGGHQERLLSYHRSRFTRACKKEGIGEVSRGEKMLHSVTDSESHITECTLVREEADDDDVSW